MVKAPGMPIYFFCLYCVPESKCRVIAIDPSLAESAHTNKGQLVKRRKGVPQGSPQSPILTTTITIERLQQRGYELCSTTTKSAHNLMNRCIRVRAYSGVRGALIAYKRWSRLLIGSVSQWFLPVTCRHHCIYVLLNSSTAFSHSS